MQKRLQRLAAVALWGLSSIPATAQTADDIVERHLAASGGRAALAALRSRTSTGSITLGTPVGDLTGAIEVYAKAPNKSRTLINLDLSGLGGGQVVSDQRFDGSTGYVIDSFNGNREMTGGQLDALRNSLFPTPLLAYRENGFQVALADRDTVGTGDAHVLVLTPAAGPIVKLFIDASTFMLVKTAVTLDVPQLGGDIEQVVQFSDFRDVDGIKVPYAILSTNPAQTVRATMSEVRHNQDIDDSAFSRPPGQ